MTRPKSVFTFSAPWACWHVGQILKRSQILAKWPNERLEAHAEHLKYRIQQSQMKSRWFPWNAWRQPLFSPAILDELFALIRVIGERELGMPHHPVQLLGGVVMAGGGLAEMQTGEGKTLTATLAASAHGLSGQGCHVITVNDYLTQRDAEKMRPIYRRLGLSVGIIVTESSPDERRQAYRCDVTYVTGREVGFDFLRDRLMWGDTTQQSQKIFQHHDHAGPVQRPPNFALVDEADSVLIDDAGTPLIIALPEEANEHQRERLQWIRDTAISLRPEIDYQWKPEHRDAHLTNTGCHRILLRAWPLNVRSMTQEEVFHAVEQALRAERFFIKDRDYLLNEKGEVAIIDEGTGRLLEGRRWQGGLHQAIEWKEGVELSAEMGEGARVTVQGFFRGYRVLAGMTGTARTARREFAKFYRLRVVSIPTHQACRREVWPPRIFLNRSERLKALVIEIQKLLAKGRSVLIGTPSVEASQKLAEGLGQSGITATLLNATRHAEEAQVIAEAGQPFRVTIATNMAGRGTDIHLAESVRLAGGLHVIATEMHTSQRIDRQLFGRAARQGDPGSCQFLLSLEDELLQQLPPARRKHLLRAAEKLQSAELPRRWFRVFQKIQRSVEQKSAKSRAQLARGESQRQKTAKMLGLDNCLEFID